MRVKTLTTTPGERVQHLRRRVYQPCRRQRQRVKRRMKPRMSLSGRRQIGQRRRKKLEIALNRAQRKAEFERLDLRSQVLPLGCEHVRSVGPCCGEHWTIRWDNGRGNHG